MSLMDIARGVETTRLVLSVDGRSWDCAEGDVIGREGSVAQEIFRSAAILSRRHLETRFVGDEWVVVLCPTARNVTWIDDVEMVPGIPYPVRGRCTISVVDLQFTLHTESRARWSRGIGAVESGGREVDSGSAPLQPPGAFGALGTALETGIGPLRSLPGCLILFDGNGRNVWCNDSAGRLLGQEEPPPNMEAFGVAFQREDETAILGRIAALAEGEPVEMHGLRIVDQAKGDVSHKLSLRFLKTGNHVLVSGDSELDAGASISALRRVCETYVSLEFQDADLDVCLRAIATSGLEVLRCARVTVWLMNSDKGFAAPVAAVPAGAGSDIRRVPYGYCPDYFDRLWNEPFTAFESGDSPALSILKDLQYADPSTAGILSVPIRGRRSLGFIAFEWEHWDGELREEARLNALMLASLALSAAASVSHQTVVRELRQREEQMAKELADAEHYVRQVLPPPLSGDLDVSWFLKPSAQLGGDAFGYHWVDDDHFAIYLLDVVGHGTGAALLSMSAVNSVRAQILPKTDFRDPAAVLAGLNAAFQMETQNDMTFTIWYGIYRASERRLIYSTAGHPPALLIDPGRANQCTELGTQGLIIGGLEGIDYHNAEIPVPPEAKLYVLSDGAFEIERPDGESWPFEQFVAAVRATGSMAEGEIEYLYDRAQQVLEGNELQDDFTMVRVRFPP